MKITKDLKRYSEGSFFKAVYTLLLNSNFQMIFWYRVANFFYKIHLSPISKIIMYFHKLTYSVDIDYRATIDGGFKIVHGLAIVIGKDVVIEKNVTIYQSVTLGGNNNKRKLIQGKERSQPYLHSGVTVYSGAYVLGPCEIGENSVIGAATLLTGDLAPNTCVFTKATREERQLSVQE